MGRSSMAGPAMLLLLCTVCRLALGITDGNLLIYYCYEALMMMMPFLGVISD